MEIIEFDPVDTIAAGALGEPGQRTFFIQATKNGATLTVFVEKEQVAVLSDRVGDLLAQVAEEHPEDPVEEAAAMSTATLTEINEPAVPLFRAVVMGIGFDPERRLVLLELYEQAPADDTVEGAPPDPSEPEPKLARLFATRTQMRAMAARGTETVAAGRPPCPWCRLPLDPSGHVCPASNGHRA